MRLPVKSKPSQLGLFQPEQVYQYTELDSVRESAMKCERCDLSKTRDNVIFGQGPVRPSLMFVGEPPGKSENRFGKPLCGRAGHRFDNMLGKIKLKREEVYVANVICCRPSDEFGRTRVPEMREIVQCSGYLLRQLRLVRPKVLVLLGKTAANVLLGRKLKTLEGYRDAWHDWDGIPTRVTYHPSYIMRVEAEQPDVALAAESDFLIIKAKVEQLKAFALSTI